MKKYILLIVVLVACLKVNSQIYELRGTIKDSTSMQPLAYGNIIIKNSADSIIRGTLSNLNGEFTLKNIKYQKGQYLLIKYVGYADKKIVINYSNTKKINVGNVLIKPDISQIKEATVVGQSKYMEQQFDRKVFNINEAKATSAKNIFDLLRTLPGVTIDMDNNVKYKGAPATIYVDDQPAEYVYPKTEMIPVVSVLKIELIDASLRNGEGKGGIINIKMKNFAADGLSGAAQANNGTVEFKDLNSSDDYINANYKLKKFLFFYNINYEHQNTHSDYHSIGSLNYGTDNYEQRTDAIYDNISNNMWNYGGIRFSPDKDTRIRLSAGFYKGNGINPSENYFQQNEMSSNALYDMYNTITTYDYKFSGNWLNASFYHSYDTIGKSLSIYGGWQSNSNSSVSNETYNYQYVSSVQTNNSENFKNESNRYLPSVYIGLFHNHPVNSKTRWNCGWSGWFQYNGHSDNVVSQNDVIDYPVTSYDKNKTQRQTASCRIGTTLKKWKLDAGISGEYDKNFADFTRYKTNSQDTLLTINKDYLSALPSATIIFSPDSLQEIKFTYSRSVQSVWYSQLCDFVDKENPRGWSSGNSKLLPASYNNLYLGYSYNKQTWNFSSDVFYSITNNDISYLTVPVNDIITISTPQNIAHNSSVGVELSAYTTFKQKCDLNFSSSINHTYISSTDFNGADLKKKDFGYNIKFSADVHLSDKNSGTFYINYFSREITFQGYNYDYINSSFSLTHKFFDSKLLLTIGINNLFDNLLKHGDYTNYSGIIQNITRYSTSYRPHYFITLQYKFRQGDRGTKDAEKAPGAGK